MAIALGGVIVGDQMDVETEHGTLTLFAALNCLESKLITRAG